MPRLKSITIENFRSIGPETVDITFPADKPVILIGENNSGKTNIIRALELMLGEFHPKYKKLDDFDHFDRNPNNRINISMDVTDFHNRLGRGQEFGCGGFRFSCVRNSENEFVAIQVENGQENQYVSAELREELLCVVVGSEQSLSYQLSYASKYTLLSRVTKSFHDKLIENGGRVERLKQLFDQIKDTFDEVDEFNEFKTNMSSIAGQMLGNMSHALDFDFSAYDPSNYFKTLRVHPTEDGTPRSIEELGTGQQQILAMTFAHAYAKSFLGQGLVFILDEPESHLHPLAQRWLAKQMFKMAEDGLQVVITTHSPYFINLEYLGSIYLIKRFLQTEAVRITPFTLAEHCVRTGATRATENTIVPFYAAHSSPQILNGFFANGIVLVEGPTEEFSLPIYLDALGMDTLKSGIAIIGVGGKGNLAKWWRMFTAFRIPTFICFDNDHSDDAVGNKRTDALRAIGIVDGDIANLLTSMDWNIGERYCVFGGNFERTFRNSFDEYGAFETEERQRLGGSKPIVAKAVAKRLAALDRRDQVGWDRVRNLVQRLENFEM
ncbi:MAG TPA: AAA family ATPase [Chryseolinea sp.]